MLHNTHVKCETCALI